MDFLITPLTHWKNYPPPGVKDAFICQIAADEVRAFWSPSSSQPPPTPHPPTSPVMWRERRDFPALFSLRSASSFACFLPARSPQCGSLISILPLVWLSNQAARIVFSALRIPHPVAAGEERRGVPSDSRHTHTHTHTHSLTRTHTHTQSLPPLLAEDGLCRRNSTEPQLFLSPTASSISPAARKLDRRSSPAGLTVRAAVCVGEQ